MKKLLIFAVISSIFMACGKSPEENANVLIKQEMNKTLYHAETYDPVETLVDSAFTPFDDPAFYEKTLTLCQMAEEIERLERESKIEKSSMSIWGGAYMSAFGKDRYNESKEKYKKAIDKKEKLEIKIKQSAEELKNYFQREPKFIGFKAKHRYRAENNNGEIVFGETKFLFDNDIKKVVYSWDMDGYEYKMVQAAYMQMRGENPFDVSDVED